VPRDYDGAIIKLFNEYEQKYIHNCRRKKALPMHRVKASISPETEKKENAFKIKCTFFTSELRQYETAALCLDSM
jgi:hypothetical protein